MDYYFEYIHHLDDNQKMLPAIVINSDISGALDNAFKVDVRHHPSRLCVRSYVHQDSKTDMYLLITSGRSMGMH